MDRVTEVRIGTVGAVAAASGLAGWLLLSLWRGAGGELPELPWVGLLPLLLLVLLVLVAGWQVRRSVRGPTPSRPTPQRARGTLVAAQASALGGAVLLGWYVANALMHLANADVPSVRGLLLRAAASAAAALLLAVAGLVAQAWCRLPPTEDDDDDDGGEEARDLAYG